jgi:hypothetical protein
VRIVWQWISAGQLTNISSWRRAFLPISFDLEVRRYLPHFEFWQSVIKERQENVIHPNVSGVSRQWRWCNCVCSGGTSSDSTTIKEADFSNFNLTYLHSCLHPTPLLPRYSLWRGRITRRSTLIQILPAVKYYRYSVSYILLSLELSLNLSVPFFTKYTTINGTLKKSITLY